MKKQDLGYYVFGKVQPQAVELEQAVLGACLLDKNAVSIAAELLKSEDFYRPENSKVFQAVIDLYRRANPVDILTVTEQLKQSAVLKECGGPAYLAELTNRIASASNVEYHAMIVRQKSIARGLIMLGSGILKDAYEETTDIFDLINTAESGIFSIMSDQRSSISGMEELAALAVEQMKEKQESPDGLTGVPTGFVDFDRLTGGLQGKKLYTIAARPGMGKTALVLCIAKNASEFDRPVAFFSLEMGKDELMNRLISMKSGINGERLVSGKLTESEQARFMSASEDLSVLPIFVDETPGITPFEIRSKSRRLKMQHDIQLVVIDYLQLMQDNSNTNRGNREQEVSAISRSLKGLSKELDVPVLALSQLNRSVETRGGSKRPQLSDLRESGAIEQDSDLVAFIYRPEYYGVIEDENGSSLKGIAELIVSKNRGGRLTTVKLQFDERTTKFTDYDHYQYGSNFPGLNEMRYNGNEKEEMPF